jgi:hypothetical protein
LSLSLSLSGGGGAGKDGDDCGAEECADASDGVAILG